MFHRPDDAQDAKEQLLKKLSRMRKWKKTKPIRATPSRSSDFQFTVMTYNILSQRALNNHRYLYKNDGCLDEDFRISRIIPEIQNCCVDIICLQEAEEGLFETRIRPEMDQKGFSALFKRRTGANTDGCAILWRRNKFDLVHYRDLEFRRGEHPLLDRDNVAMIAVLKPNHHDSRHTLLHVATTHLLYNPRRGDVKLCQIRWLLAELEQMAFQQEKPGGHRQYQPIVLCGDFNFEPTSPLYKFVDEGQLKVDAKTHYGDLSGQGEGKGKGRLVDVQELSLHELGIAETTRFEVVLKESESNEEVNSKEVPNENQEVQDLDKSSESEDEKLTISHSIQFAPAYVYKDTEKDMHFTSMTRKTFSAVDHIFYTVRNKYDRHSYTEGKMRLMYTYTLPIRTQGKDLGGLPNQLLGSDHVCLMAQFGLAFDSRR